nr:hypothetical protein [Chloroflexia bacterium]
IEAIESFRESVMGETLALALATTEVTGMSDAVEPENVEGSGGAARDGRYEERIPVGGHQVLVAIHRHQADRGELGTASEGDGEPSLRQAGNRAIPVL